MLDFKDYEVLSNQLYYKEYQEDDTVFDIGSDVNQFHMLLSGSILVKRRNPHIKNWDRMKAIEQSLLEWKVKIFDKKVEKAMQIHMFK